jgi:hypothetical protein
MNKIVKEIADQLDHGEAECGVCHNDFWAHELRAIQYQHTIVLACPSCVAKNPQAERSSMDVGQVIAMKHRVKEGADLDSILTWTPKECE